MDGIVVAHAAANSDTLLVFLPFLPALVGLLFIRVALKDRSESRERYIRALPTPREQPLRYVNVALASHRRRRAAKEPEKEAPKRPTSYPSGHPRLRRVQ